MCKELISSPKLTLFHNRVQTFTLIDVSVGTPWNGCFYSCYMVFKMHGSIRNSPLFFWLVTIRYNIFNYSNCLLRNDLFQNRQNNLPINDGLLYDFNLKEEMMRGKPGYEHLNEPLHILVEAELPVEIIDARLMQSREILEDLLKPMVSFIHQTLIFVFSQLSSKVPFLGLQCRTKLKTTIRSNSCENWHCWMVLFGMMSLKCLALYHRSITVWEWRGRKPGCDQYLEFRCLPALPWKLQFL